MPLYVCCECGTQYAKSAAPPAHCLICEDERQFVGWAGQAWTTLDELRKSHRMRIEPEDDRIVGFGIVPHFSIGQRALLIETSAGNILWDCIALIDTPTVAAINARGGLKAIAISHPHYYTTNAEWSAAFGGVPVYLHADDQGWVQRPHKAIQFWTGETLPLDGGVTLIRCGGHFEGGTVLHWTGGADNQGVILSGDILQVTQDRRWVSFMRSYPNMIPLNADVIRRIEASLSGLAFERIYGAFWGRNIRAGGRAAFDRSIRRYIDAIT
jgi:glyoxylase-like metal-dependent hydrolase (beta-lactamase superfamily II)